MYLVLAVVEDPKTVRFRRDHLETHFRGMLILKTLVPKFFLINPPQKNFKMSVGCRGWAPIKKLSPTHRLNRYPDRRVLNNIDAGTEILSQNYFSNVNHDDKSMK